MGQFEKTYVEPAVNRMGQQLPDGGPQAQVAHALRTIGKDIANTYGPIPNVDPEQTRMAALEIQRDEWIKKAQEYAGIVRRIGFLFQQKVSPAEVPELVENLVAERNRLQVVNRELRQKQEQKQEQEPTLLLAGDTVRLTSGGPAMTVYRTAQYAVVGWQAGDFGFCQDHFPLACLRRVETE